MNKLYYLLLKKTPKQKIIASIWFDGSAYGSKATTSKDGKETDKTTTIKDVEEFF